MLSRVNNTSHDFYLNLPLIQLIKFVEITIKINQKIKENKE